MTNVSLASLCLLSAVGCTCQQPQAVTRHTELDIKIGADLTAVAALPIGQAAIQFGRTVDETFKTTPGADTLDIMLYRICVTADQHKDTITTALVFEMQKEAYRTWLKYVEGTERLAAEKLKRELASQPFGAPVASASTNVPAETQQRIRRLMLKMLEMEHGP